MITALVSPPDAFLNGRGQVESQDTGSYMSPSACVSIVVLHVRAEKMDATAESLE